MIKWQSLRNRGLAFFVALSLCFNMLPLPAFAAEDESVDQSFTVNLYQESEEIENLTLFSDEEFGATRLQEAGLVGTLGTWTSSNENILTVNENGGITAVAAGEAVISFTYQPEPEIIEQPNKPLPDEESDDEKIDDPNNEDSNDPDESNKPNDEETSEPKDPSGSTDNDSNNQKEPEESTDSDVNKPTVPDENAGDGSDDLTNPDENVGDGSNDSTNPDENAGNDFDDSTNADENAGDGSDDSTNPDENAGDGSDDLTNPDENAGDSSDDSVNPDENAGDDSDDLTTPDENVGNDSGDLTNPDENVGDNSDNQTSENPDGATDNDSDQNGEISSEPTEDANHQADTTTNDSENTEPIIDESNIFDDSAANTYHFRRLKDQPVPLTGTPLTDEMQPSLDEETSFSPIITTEPVTLSWNVLVVDNTPKTKLSETAQVFLDALNTLLAAIEKNAYLDKPEELSAVREELNRLAEALTEEDRELPEIIEALETFKNIDWQAAGLIFKGVKNAEELQKAINDADAGDTIHVAANIEGNFTINKSLILDMQGYTISGMSTAIAPVFKITGGDVVLQNGSIINGNYVQSGYTRNGGGISVDNCISLTVTNCTLSGNSASNGGAIYVKQAQNVAIVDSVITNNTTVASFNMYGAVYIYRCTDSVVISNSSISDNHNKGGLSIGGGVSTNMVDISHTTIVNNDGVGLFVSGKIVILANVNVSENQSTQETILDISAADTLTMSNAIINDNSSGSSNGNIRLTGNGDLYIIDSQFTNNNYSGARGNIHLLGSGALTFDNCIISGNISTHKESAGAIHCARKGVVTLNNCLLTGNTGGIAGAILMKKANLATPEILRVTGGTVITGNTSTTPRSYTYYAGGISCFNGTELTIDSGAVYGNTIAGNTKSPDIYASKGVTVNLLAAKQMDASHYDASMNNRYFAGSNYVWQNYNAKNVLVLIKESVEGSQSEALRLEAKATSEWSARNEALIGDKKYSTLQKAIEAAKDGDEIIIIAGDDDDEGNTVYTDPLTIDKAITIQLASGKQGGNTTYKEHAIALKSGAKDALFTVAAGGSLTIDDKSSSSNSSAKLGIEGAIAVNGGSLRLNTVKMTNNIQVNGGDVVFSGGRMTGGIDLDDGNVWLQNNVIVNNENYPNHINGGSFTLDKSSGNMYFVLNNNQVLIAGENFREGSKMLYIALDNDTYNDYRNLHPDDHWIPPTLVKGEGVQFQADETERVHLTQKFNYLAAAVDEGNIVLASVNMPEDGIYLSQHGDNNDVGSYNMPVDTFAKASELARERGLSFIYVLDTIKIQDNETWGDTNSSPLTLKRCPNIPYLGSFIEVTPSGTLTLANIILDGGAKGQPNQSAGTIDGIIAPSEEIALKATGALVKVTGGVLNITDGAILQNNAVETNMANVVGGAVDIGNSGTVNMTGGEIRNNEAYHGGGIGLMHGTLNLEDGKIINNTALDKTCGGGVFVAYNSMFNMAGGTIAHNKAYNGAGIALGSSYNDAYINGAHPTLMMVGGIISDNRARSNGGGIFIQKNCLAEIRQGSIINNHCEGLDHGFNYGGGGIYVNGGKESTFDNGALHLYNVEIANNSSVFAGCPTSTTKVYLTDGAVIHDNQNPKVDIYANSGNLAGYDGKAQMQVSAFMLGGGAYNWKDSEGHALPLNEQTLVIPRNSSFKAKTDVTASDAAVKAGLAQVKTYLNGNTANGGGGAIGSNGDVFIGGPSSETLSLTVIKEWNDEGNEANRPTVKVWKYNGSGYGWVEVQGIDVHVLRTIGGEWEDIGVVRLTADNNWTATVEELPKTDASGNPYTYKVDEEVGHGYESEITQKDDGTFVFTVTNTPTVSLTLKKLVVDPFDEINDTQKYPFTLTLSDEYSAMGKNDNRLFKAVIKAANKDAADIDITEQIDNNVLEAELANGESLVITGLKPGTTYNIAETDNKGLITEIEVNNEQLGLETEAATYETGDQTLNFGDNATVVFTNSTPAPHGSLTVVKEVAGIGDQTKDWHFTITLTTKDNKPLANLQTYTYSTNDYTIENNVVSFALKHGESFKIDGLPIDTHYEVMEKEANQNQYVTTQTGNVGNIENRKNQEVKFVNTLTESETTTVTVHKVWIDNNSQDRPVDVQVQLYQNGVAYGDVVSLNEAIDWQYTWQELPLKNEAHEEYVYTVAEINTPDGYTATVEQSDSIWTITNTKEGENTGELNLRKIVTGNAVTGDILQRQFLFTLTFTDGSGAPLMGSFAYDGDKTGVISTGGTISLTDGQSVTIHGLPADTIYAISESAAGQSAQYITYSRPADENRQHAIVGGEIDYILIENRYNGGGGDNPPDGDNPPPSGDNPPPGGNTPPPELPDPNEPDSPDEVTIYDGDTPTTYFRVQDPETEEYVYVPEEDVPLAVMYDDEVPKTGDNSHWLMVICLLSLGGITALLAKGSRKNL